LLAHCVECLVEAPFAIIFLDVVLEAIAVVVVLLFLLLVFGSPSRHTG
jgi:hypothetical protein